MEQITGKNKRIEHELQQNEFFHKHIINLDILQFFSSSVLSQKNVGEPPFVRRRPKKCRSAYSIPLVKIFEPRSSTTARPSLSFYFSLNSYIKQFIFLISHYVGKALQLFLLMVVSTSLSLSIRCKIVSLHTMSLKTSQHSVVSSCFESINSLTPVSSFRTEC